MDREKGRSLTRLPRDYTIIDIETSGLNPVKDYIIEIGCIKYRKGKELNRYTSLLRPPIEISKQIENLTGITNEMLRRAPTFNIMSRALWSYLEGETLVGHNVNFDINFLYDYFYETLQSKLTNDYVDTLRLCRKKYPDFESHSLENVCCELEIEMEHHRALSDCLIVAELIERMKSVKPEVIPRGVEVKPIKKESAPMSLNLRKGQKIDLTKENPGLKRLKIGLGWREGGADYDIDAAAFLLDSSGKAMREDDCVFYNNAKHASGAVEHMGDVVGSVDCEQLKVDLMRVPTTIHKLDFTLTIYDAARKKQNFGSVKGTYLRIIDETTGAELVRFDVGNDFTIETAIVVGELYRHGSDWKFHAIGTGFSGGLAALIRNFGLKTKSEKPEQMTVSVMPDVKAAIKKLAAMRQCAMNDVLNEAVNEYLSARRQELERYDELLERMKR